ncbi:MAG: hypothetical protein H6Q71_1159 [Firmicutes bacterium]|nr:hypothetical protein [Bacillota bacterium]
MAVSLREYPVIAGKDAQRFEKKMVQNQKNMKKAVAAKLAILKK